MCHPYNRQLEHHRPGSYHLERWWWWRLCHTGADDSSEGDCDGEIDIFSLVVAEVGTLHKDTNTYYNIRCYCRSECYIYKEV